MKKSIGMLFAVIMILSLVGCSSTGANADRITKWDCSVACAEKSTADKYVITFSDVKVSSKSGTLTIQNRNDFDIVVHLQCAGEQEITSDHIPAGGCYSFLRVLDKEYTVGVHADVDENTEMKVFVYDGKYTEPYTK